MDSRALRLECFELRSLAHGSEQLVQTACGDHESRRVKVSDGHVRLPHVQGLRAVAVLAVVAFHAGHWIPGGFLGVDVFFVISGYVIVAMLLREVDRSGRVSLLSFYARRVRRLLPALAVMLVTVVVASAFLQSPIGTLGGQDLTARTAIGALLICANVVLYQVPINGYFADRALDNPLLHTWSLSVEEQFYLVVPAMVAMSAWGRRNRLGSVHRSLSTVLLTMLAGSFVLSLATSRGMALPGIASPEGFAFYSPVTRAWEFCVGSLLAVWLSSRRSTVAEGVRIVLGAVGTLLVAAGFGVIDGTDPIPGIAAVLPTAGTALLIVAGMGEGAVRSVLGSGPMVALGNLSYSWYLWHWPFIVLAPVVVPDAEVPQRMVLGAAAVISLLPAWLSMKFVEDPIRSRRVAGEWSAKRLAAMTTVVALALSAGLFLGARTGWGQEDVQRLSAGMSDGSLGQVTGCFGDVPMSDEHTDACTFGPDDATTRVLVVGDSHAESFSDAVVEASPRSRVTVLTTGGCPYLDLPSDRPLTPVCEERNDYVTNLLETTPPDVLVLGQLTNGYLDEVDGEDLLRAQAARLRRVVADLDVGVLFVGDVPRIGLNGNPCRYGVVLGPRCEVDRAAAEARSASSRRYEKALVQDVPGVLYADSWIALCDDATCRSARGDVLGYLDSDHLTSAGSRWLVDVIKTPLADLLAGRP
jgi:peptidoglycan/LPS O-acetylase OafA/YrhL